MLTRTLLRIARIDSEKVFAFIPSWSSNDWVVFDRSELPVQLQNVVKSGDHLFCMAHTDAVIPADVMPCEFELACDPIPEEDIIGVDLTITADNPDTYIHLINGDFMRVARAQGNLSTRVVPGLWKVRFTRVIDGNHYFLCDHLFEVPFGQIPVHITQPK